MIEYVDVISVQKVSHLNSWLYLISSTLILIMWLEGCSGLKSIALKVFIRTENISSQAPSSHSSPSVVLESFLSYTVVYLNWSCGWPWSQPVVLSRLHSIYNISQMSKCLSLYIIVRKKGLFSLTKMSCTWLCLRSTCWLQGASFSNTESGFQLLCNYTGPNINIQGVLTIDWLLIIFRPKSLMMHHHFLNQLNTSNSKPHRNIFIKFAEQHKSKD